MNWKDFTSKCAEVDDSDNPMLLSYRGAVKPSPLYPKIENPEKFAPYVGHAVDEPGWKAFVPNVPQLKGVARGAGTGLSGLRDWWMDDHVVEVPDRVKSFYDELVPAIRARMARDPNDFDHTMYRPGFYNDVKIRRDAWIPDLTGASGFTFLAPGTNRVYLDSGWSSRDDLTRNTDVVHELKHVQNRDGFVSGSGRSEVDDNLLQLAYPYTTAKYSYKWPVSHFADDLTKWERAASHQERIFRHYYNLWKKLGKKPTPEQYFNYIDAMPERQLERDYLNFVNGYQEKGWENDGPKDKDPHSGSKVPLDVLRNYRDALTVIAKNNMNEPANAVSAAGPRQVKSADAKWAAFA